MQVSAVVLSPHILATIAEGLTRLEDDRYPDGSRKSPKREDADRDVAEGTRATLARAGVVFEDSQWIPADQVTRGYIRTDAATGAGWAGIGWLVSLRTSTLAPGTVLYYDPECTIPLRTL